MKRFFLIMLTAVVMLGGLTACGSGAATRVPALSDGASGDRSLRIVTTIFPEYDWVMKILGDDGVNAEVTLLLDNGVDLHSFQPTAEDILNISTCDLFIYVGGESDEWVEDALGNAMNKDMVVIDLLDTLGDRVREEELIEGMEAGEEEEGEEEGPEYDEHVWLSLRNASLLVKAISDAIITLDPEHAQRYADNTADYLTKLDALDAGYREAVEAAPVRTLLFGDRFPFRYLTDDYGLSYYAAFAGCSAETEASFETVTFLADKVDELDLKVVLTIEGTDHRLAETIVQNTKSSDQRILTMDSMQSVTARDIGNGATYLSIMRDNLDVLRGALGVN